MISNIIPWWEVLLDKDDRVPYTRLDFLRIEVGSIQTKGNVELFKQLQETQDKPDQDDEVEEWNNWKTFPNIEQHSTFHEGAALEFLAWLIHNFAPYVCIKPEHKDLREKYRYQVMEESASFRDWMNADDFAFTYLSVQNSINKWHRLHKKLQEQALKEPGDPTYESEKELDKKTPGAEYKKGSSMGSSEGLIRYRALTKFFNRNFCDDQKEHVNHNAEALLAKLRQMAKDEHDEALQQAEEENDEVQHPKKKARKETSASQVLEDPDYESINSSEWDRLSQELDFVVMTPV